MLNQLKTVLLLGTMSGLLLLIGKAIGGNQGIMLALMIALIGNFFAYFYSDKMVLRMYKAQPLDEQKYGYIYDMVAELCIHANIPMPKLWYIPTPMANAFATGRNPQHASVAVTQGILDILDEHELRGVLAHEMSHIKNRDILVATVAATMATAIGYLAYMLQWAFIFGRGDRERSGGFGALLVAVLMPIAAAMVQMAISRSREYLADETGAQCSQDPLALASALEKLHYDAREKKMRPQSEMQATTASLFIVFPFSGNGMLQLFSTHPPMEKRIARLHKMAQRM